VLQIWVTTYRTERNRVSDYLVALLPLLNQLSPLEVALLVSLRLGCVHGSQKECQYLRLDSLKKVGRKWTSYEAVQVPVRRQKFP